jgi:uncharacterized protein YciI
MTRQFLVAAVALALGIGLAARAADPPKMEFERYQLVLLRRAPDAPKLADAVLEQLQAQHIGHLKKMAAAGKMMVAGPFDDQPDPSLRGLCLYRVGSVEEARRLATEDPMVKAGRLRPEVMTWMTEKGALTFPLAGAMKSR